MVKDVKVTLDESDFEELGTYYPLALNDSELLRMALNDAMKENRLEIIRAMEYDDETTSLQSVVNQLGQINDIATDDE